MCHELSLNPEQALSVVWLQCTKRSYLTTQHFFTSRARGQGRGSSFWSPETHIMISVALLFDLGDPRG